MKRAPKCWAFRQLRFNASGREHEPGSFTSSAQPRQVDMPVTWIQVRDILDEALQIPAEDRSRYLDHACPQPELRRYVNSLIISYEKATKFLEQPAVTLLAEPWQEGES